MKVMCQSKRKSRYRLPLSTVMVPTGFPSPADDYIEGKLDLNEYLIQHPAATFFIRAIGDSMIDAGIHPGDILIVDRALEPVSNDVVIAVFDGELTVKRVRKSHKRLLLIPDNSTYEPLEVTGEMNVAVWGVVTHVIHSL